jgi:hypothetical protein
MPFVAAIHFSLRCALYAMLAIPALLSAATFTVTHTGDTGAGSLRQALTDANLNAGADTIVFAIPGAGPHTLSPTSLLPELTGPTLLDGYSQPGASSNTLADGWNAQIRIRLDGLAAPFNASGLVLGTGATASTVRGIAFTGWSRSGIKVLANDSVVTGNLIGLAVDARQWAPNGINDLGGTGALRVARSAAANGQRIRIGGPLPADRNLIAGNPFGLAVVREGGSEPVLDARIEGNWFGLDGSGRVPIANVTRAIDLQTTSGTQIIANTLVGPGSGSDAVGPTSGFVGLLVQFGNSGLRAQRNRIGVDPLGDGVSVGLVPFGIGIGIDLRAASNTLGLIGGLTDAADGNLVVSAREQGIWVLEGASRQTLLRNRVFGSGIDIDLAPVAGAVNVNDALDADLGSNGLQNHPSLQSALNTGAAVALAGTLASTPNGEFLLQFFASSECNPNGHGGAQRYLQELAVGADGAGNASFNLALPAVPAGQFISALATDGVGNTSEFSACIEVDGGPRPGAIRFSATRYNAAEFSSPAPAVLRRVGGSAGAVSVRVTSENGSAEAGLDYAAIDTVVSWADGDSADKLLPLSVVDDLLIEPTESFNLRLREPGGGASLGLVSGSVVRVQQFLPVQVFANGFEG